MLDLKSQLEACLLAPMSCAFEPRAPTRSGSRCSFKMSKSKSAESPLAGNAGVNTARSPSEGAAPSKTVHEEPSPAAVACGRDSDPERFSPDRRPRQGFSNLVTPSVSKPTLARSRDVSGPVYALTRAPQVVKSHRA